MTITTRIYTTLFGKHVGTDSIGNHYYTRKNKRWVVYKHGREPSAVAPQWHGWLHYTTDVLPSDTQHPHYGWEKPPMANLTGTGQAHLPAGHLAKAGKHAPTVSAYEPWQP